MATTAPSTSVRGSENGSLISPALGILRSLAVHPDLRGSVRETYRESWFPTVPPVRQFVRSASKAKTLRGMHLHKRQWDIWHIVSDEALVRLYDHRTGEGAFVRLDSTMTLAIPPGVSHGFYTERGCILMYALTEEYDGSDEYGWYPFDGLTEGDHPGWPKSHLGLVISERDIRAPRLAEFAP